MLDVLIYLFHHYLHPNALQQHREPKSKDLSSELVQAGFQQTEIIRAFNWLEGITKSATAEKNAQPAPIRFYAPPELKKITLKSRGFLHALEQAGLLDKHTRELVIDRAMELEITEINLEAMKWVVFMVLLNQLDKTDINAESAAWIENAILDAMERVVH